VITEAVVWEGLNPSLDFVASEDDPIAQTLPVNLVLGSFILNGNMHTNPAEWLLHDHKR